MAYQKNIPQKGDKFPTSQVDLLNNFIGLDTTFSVEHNSFTSGTGKHKWVTLQRLVSAAPVGTDAKIAQSVMTSAYATPYFSYQNSADTYSVTLCKSVYNVNVAAGTHTIFDFAAANMPQCMGFVSLVDTANTSRTLFSPFFYVTGTLHVPGIPGQLASGIEIPNFDDSGTKLQLTTTGAYTVTFKIYFNAL